MPVRDDDAKLRWEDGVPVSSRFDDPYYSRADGLAEARHVFLDGNRLAERFQDADVFTIAELGFGTGLNFLAAWELWAERALPGAVLRYVSFELFPLESDQMRQALSVWPGLGWRAEALTGARLGAGPVDLPCACLEVIEGDARQSVPDWQERADAWFLDGFAPARNPELWEPDLLKAVFEHTDPGGTFATYSAAGAVRRALIAAGFVVERRGGFGSKREMLSGMRPHEEPNVERPGHSQDD